MLRKGGGKKNHWDGVKGGAGGGGGREWEDCWCHCTKPITLSLVTWPLSLDASALLCSPEVVDAAADCITYYTMSHVMPYVITNLLKHTHWILQQHVMLILQYMFFWRIPENDLAHRLSKMFVTDITKLVTTRLSFTDLYSFDTYDS